MVMGAMAGVACEGRHKACPYRRDWAVARAAAGKGQAQGLPLRWRCGGGDGCLRRQVVSWRPRGKGSGPGWGGAVGAGRCLNCDLGGFFGWAVIEQFSVASFQFFVTALVSGCGIGGGVVGLGGWTVIQGI